MIRSISFVALLSTVGGGSPCTGGDNSKPPPPPSNLCVTLSPGTVAGTAQSVDIDLYDSSTTCAAIAANAPPPPQRRAFPQNESISMRVNPGTYTVVATAFADPQGTNATGTGCQENVAAPEGDVVDAGMCINIILH